jgi:hypothetical protein
VAERQRLPLLQFLAKQTDVGTLDPQPVEVCLGDDRLNLQRFPARASGWQAPMEELLKMLPQQRFELVRHGILIYPADERTIGVAEAAEELFNSFKLIFFLFLFGIANTDHGLFGSPIDQHVRLPFPR